MSPNSSYNEKKFQIKFVEKTKTHVLCSVPLLRKFCRLRDNVEIYDETIETADNRAHARSMLDK